MCLFIVEMCCLTCFHTNSGEQESRERRLGKTWQGLPYLISKATGPHSISYPERPSSCCRLFLKGGVPSLVASYHSSQGPRQVNSAFGVFHTTEEQWPFWREGRPRAPPALFTSLSHPGSGSEAFRVVKTCPRERADPSRQPPSCPTLTSN